MKIRGIVAVMLLSAVSMCAQASPAAPDAEKPMDHAACKRDMDGKMDGMDGMKDGDKDGKMDCCKKDKDGKMSKEMDCCKKGKCAREKKDNEKKS